ncbi:MAG: hypothetical protein KAT58_05160 [candidate division Zixibacteria bacterium]|nr:hypothetical protein [candidate division Zixibacteria bacterium]
MRKAILAFAVIVCFISGLVFCFQGVMETKSFYKRFYNHAWQMASLKLAELNTRTCQDNSSQRYSLVTEDFGSFDIELDCETVFANVQDVFGKADPDNHLSKADRKNCTAYTGSLFEDDLEHYRSLFLIYISGDNASFRLSPEGKVAGFFLVTQPITETKADLLLSHWIKFLLWLGICAAVWFVLLGIGVKLIDQLELTSKKLFEAERDSIINKIVCTYNHRINSPLMGIFGSIDLLANNEEDPRKIKLIRTLGEAADQIKVATDEIATLQDYRFVSYDGETEMIALVGEKGKAGET